MIRGGGKNRATFTRVVVFLGILWTVFLLVSSIPQKSFVIAKEYQAERPFISVIVPAYNQEKYLSEAINSIIHQTYSNWEMIIVDDGSPDMSYDLALNVKATYPHLRISVLKKQNGGLSSARNYGIDRAKGQWICALDSDDYLHEQYLEKVAKTIVENPDVRLVYSNQQFFGDSTWQWDIPQYSHKRLLSEGLFPVQTVYRKVDWLAAGKYTEILPWGNEDWNLWISISSLGDIKAIKIPEYLNFYRFKQKSMQRDMAAFQEVVPMLHMMHIAEFQSTQIVKDHEVILSTYRRETHELLKKKAQKVSHYMIDLWLGMYEEKEGNNEAAIALYQSSLEKQKQQNQDFMMDWQIMWRFAIVKQKLGQMSGRKDCFLLAEKFSFLRAVLPKCLLT